MDRAAAVRLVTKLEALADPARGGTPAERATARAKADTLIRKHRLDRRETCQTTPPGAGSPRRRAGARGRSTFAAGPRAPT